MPEKNNLPATQDREVAVSEVAAPADVGTLLSQLVQRIGPDATTEMVAALEKVCDLQIKMDAITARKNFAAAKVGLQAELQSIPALGEMKQGGFVKYKYPELQKIAEVVKPVCEKHEFSYRFGFKVVPFGEKSDKLLVTTTFILTHKDGHQESTDFVCEMAEGNQLMREGSQKAGATQTASMRRAMIGGLGLTWCDPDTDAAMPEDVEKINASEVETLTVLLKNVAADKKTCNAIQARFYNWIKGRFGASQLIDIPKSAIGEIVTHLEEKKKRHGEK